MTFNLLTVLGKVTTDSVADTCLLHNQTAGNPGGVAAAKALGDMSHMAYMPLGADTNFTGELLFLDIWNSLEGMGQFFSDEQVQAGAGMLFTSREAIVWSKLDNFLSFHFPSPTGHNDRIVGMVRGTVQSLEAAAPIHNGIIEATVKDARAAGLLSHEFYGCMAAPGSPEALEVLGVDIWMNAQSMMDYYMGPVFQNAGLYSMFTATPTSTVWAHPEGDWIEW